MISKTPINPYRIRRITGSFSWLDHRLLSDGFLAAMTPEEMRLYFFLVLVGDKNGLSFYSYDKICDLIKMDVARFMLARSRLIEKSLIACENGRYQVLQLPETTSESPSVERPRSGSPTAIRRIFQQIVDEKF